MNLISNGSKNSKKSPPFPAWINATPSRQEGDMIIVKPEDVSDDEIVLKAREIVKKIESELEYPGQIKVNVIRETRATEYAK